MVLQLITTFRLGGAVASSRFCDRDNSEVNDLIPNVEAKVMDLDGQSELLPGEEGELWFRSPTVAEGYWANEEATKGAFMDDGWFRTGDIGTITGKGKLKALGRKDVSDARNLRPLDSSLRRVCEMTSLSPSRT